MKVRIDFVTNSSSSSFLIVGVSDDSIIEVLGQKEGKSEFECSYGVDEGKVVSFYGCYSEPYYAGIDIEGLMDKMTLPQIKEYFKDLIKKEYDVDIDISDIGLHYGEVGE